MKFIFTSIFIHVLFLGKVMGIKLDPFATVEEFQNLAFTHFSGIDNLTNQCNGNSGVKWLQTHAVNFLCDEKMGKILDDKKNDKTNADQFSTKMGHYQTIFCNQLKSGKSFEEVSKNLFPQMSKEIKELNVVGSRLSQTRQEIPESKLFDEKTKQKLITLIDYFTVGLKTFRNFTEGKQFILNATTKHRLSRRKKRNDEESFIAFVNSNFMECVGGLLLVSFSGAFGIKLGVMLGHDLQFHNEQIHTLDMFIIAGLIFCICLFCISIKAIWDACVSKN